MRELENVILRSVLLTEADAIGPEELALPCDPSSVEMPAPSTSSYQAMKREVIAGFEREYLTRLMNEHKGNVTQAARASGKERREFGRLLKKHSLDRSLFQA